MGTGSVQFILYIKAVNNHKGAVLLNVNLVTSLAHLGFVENALNIPQRHGAGFHACHGGRRVGRGRCWKSHGVRVADDIILSYLIIVVPSVQCCESVISPGLRSAVRRPLTSAVQVQASGSVDCVDVVVQSALLITSTDI